MPMRYWPSPAKATFGPAGGSLTVRVLVSVTVCVAVTVAVTHRVGDRLSCGRDRRPERNRLAALGSRRTLRRSRSRQAPGASPAVERMPADDRSTRLVNGPPPRTRPTAGAIFVEPAPTLGWRGRPRPSDGDRRPRTRRRRDEAGVLEWQPEGVRASKQRCPARCGRSTRPRMSSPAPCRRWLRRRIRACSCSTPTCATWSRAARCSHAMASARRTSRAARRRTRCLRASGHATTPSIALRSKARRTVRRRARRPVPYRVSIGPLRAGGGEIVGGLHRAVERTAPRRGRPGAGRSVASVVARDDGEEERAAARFRGLLESAPDAMVIADARGHIVLANAQAEDCSATPAASRRPGGRGARPGARRRRACGHLARVLRGCRRYGRWARGVSSSPGGGTAARSRSRSACRRSKPPRARSRRWPRSATSPSAGAPRLALREAEERFRRAFDEAPIGMAMLDLGGPLRESQRGPVRDHGLLARRARGDEPGGDHAPGRPRRPRSRRSRAMLAGDAHRFRSETRLGSRAPAPGLGGGAGDLLRDADAAPAQVPRPDPGHHRPPTLRGAAAAPGRPRRADRAAQPPQLRARARSPPACARRATAAGARRSCSTSTTSSSSTTRSATTAGDEAIITAAGRARARGCARPTCSRGSAATSSRCCSRRPTQPKPRAGRRRAARSAARARRSSSATARAAARGQRRHRAVRVRAGTLSGEDVLVNADLAMYDAKNAGRDRADALRRRRAATARG